MLIYRISRSIYSEDLSGKGSGLYGGRWNPKGINLLYTAGSISLACMEYLVHNIPIMGSEDICLTKIEISKTAGIQQVDRELLANDWNEKSYLSSTTQAIGQIFFETGLNYVLKVPSAIIPDEFNYLLNPLHPAYHETKIIEQIDPFIMDERLF